MTTTGRREGWCPGKVITPGCEVQGGEEEAASEAKEAVNGAAGNLVDFLPAVGIGKAKGAKKDKSKGKGPGKDIATESEVFGGEEAAQEALEEDVKCAADLADFLLAGGIGKAKGKRKAKSKGKGKNKNKNKKDGDMLKRCAQVASSAAAAHSEWSKAEEKAAEAKEKVRLAKLEVERLEAEIAGQGELAPPRGPRCFWGRAAAKAMGSRGSPVWGRLPPEVNLGNVFKRPVARVSAWEVVASAKCWRVVAGRGWASVWHGSYWMASGFIDLGNVVKRPRCTQSLLGHVSTGSFLQGEDAGHYGMAA